MDGGWMRSEWGWVGGGWRMDMVMRGG